MMSEPPVGVAEVAVEVVLAGEVVSGMMLPLRVRLARIEEKPGRLNTASNDMPSRCNNPLAEDIFLISNSLLNTGNIICGFPDTNFK